MITSFQYRLLHELIRKTQSETFTYDQARGNGILQQMHRLTDKGVLEYVSPSGDASHGSWRLTEQGRALLGVTPCPLSHTPNAETIAAMKDSGGEVYHGTTEEIFSKILAED